MSKKFFIVVLALMAVVFGYYGYLGGFDAPAIKVTTSEPLYVAGQYYEGPADNPTFGELFKKAGQFQESQALKGSLANIYYNNPEAKSDTIKAFIGVVVPDTAKALPAGFELRSWAGGQKVVQVTTQAHYLLAPNKLYPALFDYLKEKKLKARDLYLEQFPRKDYATVEAVLLK